MQAKKRYLTLLGSVSLLALFLCYVGYSSRSSSSSRGSQSLGRHHHGRAGNLGNFMQVEDLFEDTDLHSSSRQRRSVSPSTGSTAGDKYGYCRMETCFDFSKCTNGFKVYVYPTESQVGAVYSEILDSLYNSKYYTTNALEACIFIVGIDTLDRDTLSTTEYQANVQDRITKLAYWNNGRNHVIFNLYSGTWPDYFEDDMGFDIGEAILAKASISQSRFRPNFDISFPLFHKDIHSKGGEKGFLVANNVPPVRQFTLVFKGKRYLTGIGSETRNSLYHIHNGEDILLLTTCKHGVNWMKLQDERCPKDNEEYDKYDYKTLLHNSTFCLVPRGRRLGSYR